MARRSISSEVKAQIVEAMRVEGAKSSEVALRFNVSVPTVYNYLKQAQVATVEVVEA
jgi:transposase-like protein